MWLTVAVEINGHQVISGVRGRFGKSEHLPEWRPGTRPLRILACRKALHCAAAVGCHPIDIQSVIEGPIESQLVAVGRPDGKRDGTFGRKSGQCSPSQIVNPQSRIISLDG